MRRIRIQHVTEYQYPQTVVLLSHRLLVRPREGHDVQIESSRLDISPAYHVRWTRDPYGNIVATLEFQELTATLKVASEVIVQLKTEAAIVFPLALTATQFPFQYDEREQPDLLHYVQPLYLADQPHVMNWLGDLVRPGQHWETSALLNALNAKIANEIRYEVREEPGVQSPKATLDRGRGSCRDVATLFIEACRGCGLAARFVSGYLLSSASARDTHSTHAWSEVYLPGSGWCGFDSTSGLMVDVDHIAVAVHRHPEAIAPISGSFIGPKDMAPTMRVEVATTML